METQTFGQILKRERLKKGISQRKLAELAGLDPAYLNQLERDKVGDVLLKTSQSIAKALDVSPDVFAVAGLPAQASSKPLSSLMDEVTERLEALELIELPLRGVVPAGYPSLEEQQEEGIIEVSKEDLGAYANKKGLYALRVQGDSLIGDEIHNNDAIVIDPTPEIIDGKIYIVKVGNEVVARHIFRLDSKVKLVSSNGDYKEMELSQIEIQGRVILSGRWKRH